VRWESLGTCPDGGREADGVGVRFGKEGEEALLSVRLRENTLGSRDGRFNRGRMSVELRRRRLMLERMRGDSPSSSR